MNMLGAPRWVRILLVLIICLLVWGFIGYVIGGWSQALILGIVGGLAMAVVASIPILRSDDSEPKDGGKY